MADIEKTLEDLKLLNALCHGTVLDDAIALLQEQEAAYQGDVELLRQKTILFDDAIKRLKEQEAVVRCKDCKQGEQSVLPNRHLWCRIHEFYREPDWYCADGERRTDDV